MALSLESLKSHFPIFLHRPELVYLDSAATSQKPRSVIEAMTDFYEKENANVHRGLYELSSAATRRFEAVRTKVSDLLHAGDPQTISFTKGTTESINIVAQSFLKQRLKQGDNVVISAMEHHANLIPWQQVCAQRKAMLRIIPVDKTGELMLEKIEALLDTRTKFLAVTHISNVLGVINPIGEVISAAHRKNIPVLIDGAQSVGHLPIDVARLNLDFLAFSAHKMFGPLGTGVLYCKKEFASEMAPYNFGGGSIKNVEFDHTEFLDYPRNLEAGTANISGVIGLGAAIDFILDLNLSETALYTSHLSAYFKERLKSIGKIKITGEPKDFSGIVSFTMENIHPHYAASFLAQSNIAVRAGHHCAQPLLESMHIPSTVRASFSIYNTQDDVDKTIEELVSLKKFWS